AAPPASARACGKPDGMMTTPAPPAEPAGTVLSAQGLYKRFGGVQAVRDISFAVPAANVFAITGPNGAGKSTLINLLSGIHQPDAGRISFDGADLVGLMPH